MNGRSNLEHLFHRINTNALTEEIFFDQYHHPYFEGSKENFMFVKIPQHERKNSELMGHFQSEPYFAHHSDLIREVFAPSDEILHFITEKNGPLEELFKIPVIDAYSNYYSRKKRSIKGWFL